MKVDCNFSNCFKSAGGLVKSYWEYFSEIWNGTPG